MTASRRGPRTRWLPALAASSLLINIGLIAGLGPRRLIARLTRNTYFALDEPAPDRYRDLPVSAGGIVFVGDSIISQMPVGDMFADLHNRGIGGQTVAQIAPRIADYLRARPRALVILAGTNDILRGDPPAQVLRRFEKMCRSVIEPARPPQVMVLSAPPVRNDIRRDVRYRNGSVEQYNEGLRGLARELQYSFLDIAEILSDDDARAYTSDGVHLTALAYVKIRSALAASLHLD